MSVRLLSANILKSNYGSSSYEHVENSGTDSLDSPLLNNVEHSRENLEEDARSEDILTGNKGLVTQPLSGDLTFSCVIYVNFNNNTDFRHYSKNLSFEN